MKKIFVSLLFSMTLLAEVDIIESIPLDNMSDLHLEPVDIPYDEPVRVEEPAKNPEEWMSGLGEMHQTPETKKSYLRGILDGQQYGAYAIADLESEALVKRFYAKRHYKTFWISAGFDVNPNLFGMLNVIKNAGNEALNSTGYHVGEIETILSALKNNDSLSEKDKNLAVTEIDVLLSDAFFTMAFDLREGGMSYKKFKQIVDEKGEEKEINYKWANPKRHINYIAFLEQLGDSGTLEDAMANLSSGHEMLVQLMQAYHRYTQIVAEGGWKKIPSGKQLRKGVISKKRVPLLAKRLYMSGDLAYFDPNITVVTAEIRDAIKHYQERMGLWPSGALTDATRNSLNVSATKRLKKIKLNIARMRWEKEPFGLEYVYVNIPEFMMRFYKDGLEDVKMKAVVGKVTNPTPIFDSRFTYMVLNPTWAVPKSIVVDEMLTRIQEDPDYLVSRKFKLYDSWKKDRKELDAFDIDWWQYDEESHIPYTFIRQPGAGNPLGLVKFMFPNKYAVYMHDTPQKKLFKNAKRAYSHGCIRLHKPQELLAYMSDHYTNTNYDEVMKMQENGKTQSIVLNHGIPVHVRYYTAWAGDDGSVHFRNDIYGYDAIQYKLLKK